MTPYLRPHTNDAEIWRDVFERNSYRLGPMPGWHVLDIGAHIGSFSRAAAERGAIVRAFEPAADCVATFMLNTSGLPVTLEQKAVLAEAGKAWLIHCPIVEEKSGHTICIPHGNGPGEEVEAVAFESVVNRICFECDTAAIDLCKLDAEAAEYPILLDTPDAALHLVKRWVIEFHDFDRHRMPWARLAHIGLKVDWQQKSDNFLLVGLSR